MVICAVDRKLKEKLFADVRCCRTTPTKSSVSNAAIPQNTRVIHSHHENTDAVCCGTEHGMSQHEQVQLKEMK
jgi:hypothetical protein